MLVPEAEYRKVVYSFNDTAVEYPREKCIHALFTERAKICQNKTALVFEEKQFTYRQLDEMSNSLAHDLRGRGVKPDKNRDYPFYDVERTITLRQLVEYRAEGSEDTAAFTYENPKVGKVSVSYGQFRKQTEAFGMALYDLGIRDARTGIFGGNSYEWLLAFFAVTGSGGQILDECVVRIAHPDADSSGEVCVKGPMVMQGYYNM